MRVEALGQLAAHVEEAAQLPRQRLAARQQAGRLDGGGRLVGEDGQDPQVVVVEAAEPELGQRHDPDRDAVVAHRHDDHRLVDVVGPGDGRATRVGVGVVDEDRLARVAATQPVKPSPEPTAEQVHVDLLVRADPALEGDGHDLVGQLDEIHPGVVVVDDPARLLDDDPPDPLDRRGPAEAAGGGLQGGQLGGSCLGPREQLGVGQGDPGVAWPGCR